MRPNTTQENDRLGRIRSSSRAHLRQSTSALPQPQSSLRGSRLSSLRNTSSSYRHSIGGDGTFQRSPSQQSSEDEERPISQASSKENLAPPDAEQYEKYRREIEGLKAEVGTLQYRLQTAEQEKEIALSQHVSKVEEAQRQEKDASEQKNAAETAQSQAASEVESIKKELEEVRETTRAEKAAAERATREAQDEVRLLREELEDLATAKEDAARIADKKSKDAQMQISGLQRSMEELEQETQSREAALQQAQEQVAERDNRIAQFEAEVLRLKAQGGDAETMAIIKKELTEQVTYIRKLEATNRDQLAELKHLRSVQKAVEVVEEEKRSLQRKLQQAESIEIELEEAKLQRRRLEDERLAWTAYLQRESGDGSVEFESPEQLARALVQERFTSASHVEQIGALQAEASAIQSTIRSLEAERAQLKEQAEAAQTSANAITADKARMRIERQRALAVKEVEYLRAQLKTFDTEDETMQPEQFDQARAQRIKELEELVDQYKSEVQSLHTDISNAESKTPGSTSPSQPVAGNKRSRSEVDDQAEEQLGQLTRKNRKLQEEAAAQQTQVALLEKDLAASREQLTALKEQSKTRILSLRSNPTSDHERIKQSTLNALQKENKDLLARLKSKTSSLDPSIPLIPNSVLASMEREIAAAKAATQSSEKSAMRLKQVWGSKSHEFKEAIFSTLGWTVTFIPNGKMRVESTFYPSVTDENENSIVFDGERGTMKVGGGPKSAFARKIADQIGFWVREKGCIPGFLAALTLEFYEEKARAEGGE